MKIFNLQSRKNLIWFSVIFGLILNVIICKFSKGYIYQDCGELCLRYSAGWPFVSNSSSLVLSLVYAFLFNFIFWILAVFVVLSLIKYLKSKRLPLNS